VEGVLQRVGATFAAQGICVVVAAEGVRDEGGNYWAELLGGAGQDPSGQRVFSMSSGVSAFLAQRIQATLGLRVRQVRLNTAQRSNRSLASPADQALAAQAGRAAVAAWQAGQSGVMISLAQDAAGWRTASVAVATVAGQERLVPAAWIDAAAYDVRDPARTYIAAVAGPLPPLPLLWTET
jgi:6-phosphofructokinase 1